VRGGERWTALEFADVCEAVAAELRARGEARAIAPTERMALFEWLQQLKSIVVGLSVPADRGELGDLRRGSPKASRSPDSGPFSAKDRGFPRTTEGSSLRRAGASAVLRETNEQIAIVKEEWTPRIGVREVLQSSG
jgi:hypothetical protein